MPAPGNARFKFRVVADDRLFAVLVGSAMRLETLRLRIARREAITLKPASRDKADVLVYAFDAARMDEPDFADRSVAEINRDAAKVKIFLQLQGTARADIDRKNRLIETMGRRCGAHLVTTADLMRSGASKRLTRSGKPNLVGYLSIAHVALRAVKTHTLRDTLRIEEDKRNRHPTARRGNRTGRPGLGRAVPARDSRRQLQPRNHRGLREWLGHLPIVSRLGPVQARRSDRLGNGRRQLELAILFHRPRICAARAGLLVCFGKWRDSRTK